MAVCSFVPKYAVQAKKAYLVWKTIFFNMSFSLCLFELATSPPARATFSCSRFSVPLIVALYSGLSSVRSLLLALSFFLQFSHSLFPLSLYFACLSRLFRPNR